jgi:hypothetical protein
MTCPNCKCQNCRTTELNAVLSRRASRETTVDEANAAAIQFASDQSAWRDTVEEGGR